MEKDSFEYLILQAGSIDVTNLNTKDKPEEYLTYFKQEVIMSAQHLFSAAVTALQEHPRLKKLIIMNLTPRYDDTVSDPLSLKPALALLFNNTLQSAWIDSSVRDRLVIGTHSLDCVGATQEARYRDTKTGKFDGVHLYGSSGRKAYTVSVLDILKVAGILNEAKHVFVSGQIFYKRLVQQRYQKGKWECVKPSNESSNDATNDRDIRNHKNQEAYRKEFSVPTYNRFDPLNY